MEPVAFTLIGPSEEKDQMTPKEFKSLLETGSDAQKISAMKSILSSMLQGETLNELLMHVIRFVMPSQNKALKKLCVLYWEICQKYNPDGSQRPEMVLVCNALRNDLLHPNEFIRGSMLRFLCKLKEVELLEPLVPSIRQCLEHKHPYVRKNAVLAIYSVFKKHENLIPDAIELVQNYLQSESDQGARRNALLMLMNTNLPSAVAHYHSVVNHIVTFDDQLQLCFIDVIRLDCKNPSADKAKYIQTIISLLGATSSAVRFQAANTLTFLSNHSTAIKAAAACYLDLGLKESDNNVKLIVLEKISELQDKNMEDTVMDVLRIVSSPDLSVRKKCLDIATGLLSIRNAEEVIQFLKKELAKTQDGDYDKNVEYRHVLIQTIHSCAIKFPQFANSVVGIMMEFLTETSKIAAVDVVTFIKEVMERFPDLRHSILEQLLQVFPQMKTSSSIRGALWIIGEFSQNLDVINLAMRQIMESVGKIPILDSEIEGDKEEAVIEQKKTGRKLLADGTYATESAFTAGTTTGKDTVIKHPIRTLIFGGDFYVCAVLATTLVKLSLRVATLVDKSQLTILNVFKTKAMLILTSIIRAGKSNDFVTPIDEDSFERIVLCIRLLSSENNENGIIASFLSDSHNAFSHYIEQHAAKAKPLVKSGKKSKSGQVDDLPNFRLLRTKKQVGGIDSQFSDISKATGSMEVEQYVSKLDRIRPLTGFSDPVYCEAFITVNQFDILIDILVINQTTETLQNLCVEFSTQGDLKLVEKPVPSTIGPHGFHSFKTNFKVSSTESTIIFGNIVYDGTINSDFKCIVLQEIACDIMDYIKPGTVDETRFKSMWDEFEWENKINVQTSLVNLKRYLDFTLKVTNMNCLTPLSNLKDCGFLAANLYAQTIFGEDALANICLELSDGKVAGHIRIRSKTQGIALSLGEKISANQKDAEKFLK